MPDGEAAFGAAAARAVLSSTVPSSVAAPRRPPRRILSGSDLAQPPHAPQAAAAAAARGGVAAAGNAVASDAPLSPANAALLAELHREAGELAGSVTALLASLRAALARGSACTAEHLGLYAAAAEGVAAETRDAVRGASAFVAAATQLATELPALEHLAEQTQHVRAQLEALEAAAAKVLPPPPAPPRTTVAALFSRGGT